MSIHSPRLPGIPCCAHSSPPPWSFSLLSPLLRAITHSKRPDSAYLCRPLLLLPYREGSCIVLALSAKLHQVALHEALSQHTQASPSVCRPTTIILWPTTEAQNKFAHRAEKSHLPHSALIPVSPRVLRPSLRTVGALNCFCTASFRGTTQNIRCPVSGLKRQSTRGTPPLDSHIVISFLPSSNVHWSVDLDCVLRLRTAQHT